ALPLEDIKAFVADVPPHVAVILDEAYTEFNIMQDPDESIGLRKRHPNLVLLRTFSKVYGLCGLRVGFGLCGSEDFRTAVDQVRQPFFCNAAAPAGDLAGLRPPRPRGRPRARRRSPGRSPPAASSATSPSGSFWRTGCAGSGW